MSFGPDDQNPYFTGITPTNEPPRYARKPAVVGWFQVYAVFMCLLYLLVAALSLIFFSATPEMEREMDLPRGFAKIYGFVFLLMGLPLSIASILPLFFPPRPWLWIYGIVMIALGLSSPCLLPACVPMLIYWMRDETKAWYGKS